MNVPSPKVAAAVALEDLDPELSLYRNYTIAMLRRYFRMSIELGRLPSVLGREFFRCKITSYRMHTFEDVVILVHDVERCIGRLDAVSQQLIAKVILQENTHDEAAVLLGCTRRTVGRQMLVALDSLSEIFLRAGILQPLGKIKKPTPPQTCQEGENSEMNVSA